MCRVTVKLLVSETLFFDYQGDAFRFDVSFGWIRMCSIRFEHERKSSGQDRTLKELIPC